MDFFQHYAKFKFEHCIISLVKGENVENHYTLEARPMRIENPLEPMLNVSQNVSECEVIKFQEMCAKTFKFMKSDRRHTANLATLLGFPGNVNHKFNINNVLRDKKSNPFTELLGEIQTEISRENNSSEKGKNESKVHLKGDERTAKNENPSVSEVDISSINEEKDKQPSKKTIKDLQYSLQEENYEKSMKKELKYNKVSSNHWNW